MIYFLSIGLPILYVLLGSAFGQRMVLERKATCWAAENNEICDRSGHEHEGYYAAGLIWPLWFLFIIGCNLGYIGFSASNETRSEIKTRERREREIEEAKHQAKLAELKAAEHAALDRELALLERKHTLESR